MTSEKKWRAVVENNVDFDGVFFYAVRTTKIFCRPSCKSKTPNRNNVAFFNSPRQAMEAGFRPCKRCRPDLPEYHPTDKLIQQAKDAVDTCFANMDELKWRIKGLGLNEKYLNQLFFKTYGKTMARYLRFVRIKKAQSMLSEGKKAAECAFACGFESLSAFYASFHKEMGCTPKEFCLFKKESCVSRL